MSARVILRSVAAEPVHDAVTAIMERLEWRRLVPKGGRVVIKPNLCTERPELVRVANTDARIIEAVCRVLLQQTPNITIGESDGIRYKAEAAFESNGIYALADRLGTAVVNFSRGPTRQVQIPGMAGWELPVSILDADCFITLPKLKTHATTVFTGSLKNQWGCIPRHDRILLHKRLDRLIVAVNKALCPKLAIMDGMVGMEGRGPINGTPVEMNVLLGSRDLVALDATAMRLVGLDPAASRHLVLAHQERLGEIGEASITIDGDVAASSRRFEPARRDWAIKALNMVSRSRFLTRHLLLDDTWFYPIRRLVTLLRSLRADA